MLRKSLLALIAAMVMIVFSATFAAVPGLISYQGRVTTAAGQPVADGTYFLRFQIYDAPVGGTALWNSNIQPVQVTGGLYTYILGQDVAFPNGLFSGGNRWLGVTVGVDPEMAPRQQMIATGYAFVSQNADSVEWSGIMNMPAGFADGIDDNSGDITAVNTSGGLTGGVTSGDANISIASGGVTSSHIANSTIVDADIAPGANIAASKINGTLATLNNSQTFTATNRFNGLLEVGDSTMRANNTGVTLGRNLAPSDTYLLETRRRFNTSASRYGSYTFIENAGTGALYANFARAEATTLGDAGAGFVVGTYSHSESDNFDRYGSYSSTIAQNRSITTGEGFGAYGSASDGQTAYGVYGEASSALTGYGVYGHASDNTGGNYGMFAHGGGGTSTGGVWAEAFGGSQSTTGVTAIGQSSNGTSRGLSADAWSSGNSSYGVYASARTATGFACGIFANAVSENPASEEWAGRFGGDVNVTGTIFVPSFVETIDHPLDPENKTLRLAGMVSPQMTNVTHGNVTTNTDGLATVTLPEYFTAISTDFRYQLTVVGQFAQAIIAEEISDASFVIRTDKPDVKVSWLVAAIRNDGFARVEPLVVEAEKSAADKGRYLQPQAFGLGSERSVDYPILQQMKENRAANEAAAKSRPNRSRIDAEAAE